MIKMETLLSRLKPEIKEELDQKLEGFPHIKEKLFRELNEKNYINELSFDSCIELVKNQKKEGLFVNVVYDSFND